MQTGNYDEQNLSRMERNVIACFRFSMAIYTFVWSLIFLVYIGKIFHILVIIRDNLLISCNHSLTR